MLNIEQFRYGTDNFAYLMYGKQHAIAIDGGAFQEILSFLRKRNLNLILVTNTHSHYDHTSGNDYLIKETKANFLTSSFFSDNHKIPLDGDMVSVYRTPGHTDDSICFHAGTFLISGDTLFNGTIGNCFSGNLKNFYLTVKRLLALPDDTVVYAGHDYVLDSLAFAKRLEPDNKDIESFCKTYNLNNIVCSTISQERKINPYFRFNEESIINILKSKNLPYATEWERWNSLMSIE